MTTIAAKVTIYVTEIVTHDWKRFASHVQPKHAVDAAAYRVRIIAVTIQPNTVDAREHAAVPEHGGFIRSQVDGCHIEVTMAFLDGTLLSRVTYVYLGRHLLHNSAGWLGVPVSAQHKAGFRRMLALVANELIDDIEDMGIQGRLSAFEQDL
jgi:hypothetical protein